MEPSNYNIPLSSDKNKSIVCALMLFSTTLIPSGTVMAQTPDTLQAVTVVADRGVVVSRTDTVKVDQFQTISEIFIRYPGANVSDNGGYAGLKTLNLRGMGSPHTAIYVDGVRVGNVQSGQADLGALGLGSYSCAVIDYAQNSVSFITDRPSFSGNRKIGGKTRLSAGSFDTWLPSARTDWKISDKITLSANAEGIISKGDFSYGDGLTRENNDVTQFRGGVDIFGTIAGGDYHAKAWYNGSDRGTPGSTSWPSEDRQRERNTAAQALLRKQFTSFYHLTASGKFSYDDIFYTSAWGDSKYSQTETQLNSTHILTVRPWLDISLTADINLDALNSTSYDQKRLGTTGAAAAAFSTKRLKSNLALQYDGVFDKGHDGRNCLSPSFDLRYVAFEGFDIVGFARRAYRVPTFNELYYVGYGNPDLKPEDALLTDIGIDWRKTFGNWFVKARIDGFYNILKDKITSAPSPEDPNVWQPYNIGKVKSNGADLMAGLDWSGAGWLTSFAVRYGYQDAVDKTPDSSTYGKQIAYIARHSLSMDASASVKGWIASTVWDLRAGRRDSSGEMPDWNTLDLNLGKSFDFGRAGTIALKLALKNITDKRYELSSGYPMPGFSVTGGIEYKY